MKAHYAFEEAITNLRHGGFMNLLSLTIIALTGMILSALVLVGIHINAELRRLKDQPAIVVYLEDSVDPSTGHQLRSQVEKLRDVKSVVHISKADALNRANTVFGQDAEAVIAGFEDVNPFPASLEIRMMATDSARVGQIASEIRTYEGIEDVRYERSSTDFIRQVQYALIGLSILLGSASVIIVCFSIMLTVYFRREEYRTLRLVGATYWFIRLPLLVTGTLLGLVGSSLGLLGFYTVFQIFTMRIGTIEFLSPLWVCFILGAGSLLGLIGGAVPVQKYLNA